MQPLNQIDRQRTFSNQNLGSILTIGFGGSVLLHLVFIAGISYWWKPPAAIDEPLEITLVEPISDKEAIDPLPIKLPPKPAFTPTPIVLKPISIPTQIPPIPQSIPLAVKPTPIVIKPKLIAIKSKSKPNLPPPKPKQITPKPLSNLIPQSIANPPFPADKFRPINTPSAPTAFNPPTNSKQLTKKVLAPIKSTSAEPSSKKIAPSTFNQTPNIPTASSNSSPPLTQTSRDSTQPKWGENLSASGNRGGILAEKDRSDNRSTGDILAGNGDRSGATNSTKNEGGNSTSDNGSSLDSPTASRESSVSPATASNPTAGSGNGNLQCVQNCQIAKLQDLQDSDGGKDRLRIRIVVEANGALLSAEIAKSSGNPQIDSVVLAGIKQMKFNPTGKIIKGIIRANILL